jgi:hypothetical protein
MTQALIPLTSVAITFVRHARVSIVAAAWLRRGRYRDRHRSRLASRAAELIYARLVSRETARGAPRDITSSKGAKNQAVVWRI